MKQNATSSRFPDLEAAEVGDELQAQDFPKEFDVTDYPKADDLISFIRNKNTPSMPFTLRELSVNGEVVADSMNEYLNKKAISSSACKEVLKTPLHYFHYSNQTFKKEEKKCFELGTFAHRAFLEPKLFDAHIVEPNYSLSSFEGVNTGIKFWEGQYATDKILKTNVFPAIEFIQDKFKGLDMEKLAVRKEYLLQLINGSPLQPVDEETKLIIDILKSNYNRYGGGILPKLLSHSLKEVSFYGIDEQTELPVKVRPDGLQLAKNIGVDAVISFKTTSANTLDKFIYDATKLAYELSEGVYQDVLTNITGKKFNVTLMVMLQTVPPYLPALFWWDATDIANGKYKYRMALNTIKECADANQWPGFDAMAEAGHMGIINMKQPDWNKKEINPVQIEN